ncbi:DinB superfamily protein [Arachidicoccus rhizosphaerae]|jgi:hypothetical protein|uniref:DinB superfamily protein n=1 Tax=Arachidicoccus rhizosphaerae TaxID=551991 RepID=A0A1H3ZS19_9BACT|nr:DinB family protein [Arachidicoccus rhizosphaerae]SEA26563.1 DinB superfamily protein [Arachidicoccus rhizosphaerae]
MIASITQEKIYQLEVQLLEAVRNFVEVLYDFDETVFNQRINADNWSAAQVGCHVVKSLTLIHQLVNGPVEACPRSADENIAILKRGMEDMHVKGKSAEILRPGTEYISRTLIRTATTEAEQALLKDIRDLDLTLVCQGMDFPELGRLTRYELIGFAGFHMDRHRKQLLTIWQSLNKRA